MAGPIQSALSGIVTGLAGAVVAGKKLSEDEKSANAKAIEEAKKEAEYQRSIKKEASESALEADLVNMGADPDSAHAFMLARNLGMDTSQFGIIRKKGKFVGSYSSLAEKLSKDSLTDSLSSRVINEAGFAQRVYDLGGSRKGRVTALVEASKGGKK